MQRINSVNARPDTNGTGKKGFHDNADLSGQDATYLTPDWCNTVQEELSNVVELSGLTLDSSNNQQLYQAIRYQLKLLSETIYHIGSWHGSNNIDYDPSTALEPFLGQKTTWVLWPYIPQGVSSLDQKIGLISGLGHGENQVNSTRIWQRLENGATLPTYNLTVNKASINEGDEIELTLITTGLSEGTPVDWEIIGLESTDILPTSLSGQFITDKNGQATYKITMIEDQITDGNKTFIFKLKYIKNQQVTILAIDSSKYTSNENVYYEGNYKFTVKPNQTITVDMFASGGGGGGSVYTSDNSNASGTDGNDIILSYDTSIVKVGGGKLGTGGRWGNGSHFFNGVPGQGGTNNIESNSKFEILINQVGNSSVEATRWNRQEGGVGIDSSIGTLNGGGSGGWGIGDEKWSYGGGGGSGGRLKAKYTNESSEPAIIALSIGKFGLGWKTSGNFGEDGGVGYAIVMLN